MGRRAAGSSMAARAGGGGRRGWCMQRAQLSGGCTRLRIACRLADRAAAAGGPRLLVYARAVSTCTEQRRGAGALGGATSHMRHAPNSQAPRCAAPPHQVDVLDPPDRVEAPAAEDGKDAVRVGAAPLACGALAGRAGPSKGPGTAVGFRRHQPVAAAAAMQGRRGALAAAGGLISPSMM